MTPGGTTETRRTLGQRIGDWLAGCLILVETKLRRWLCPWTDDDGD